ncbi:unnamed protein product [Rotaria sp. Silwood1]|nr:unnamed protein product [Rotaria sp. Silwood1]CAF0841941.1 unnamed protein product [Rotaria sp. Silwood1]CAF1018536.1 unnamed protein product [Rotaria sp. Silwood1]CAF3341679.1 unnamed protein product [Rotaria sp. Silwood1]CAF3363976.1 unnamed protein product [Rotaria sp. Silwood1]
MSNASNSLSRDLKRAIAMCKWTAPSPLPASRAIRGRTTVELFKKEGCPLGLTISGGIDKDSKPRVAQLKPGSLAQKADVLEIGDVLLGINGIKTAGLKHEQVIDLIKQVGDQLTLDIEYDLPKWPIHAINTVHTKTIQIQLEKEGQSYGFILRGGGSDDKVKARPLIITKIRPQGPADKEGTIKIGDRVLAINGINVGGATLQDAYNLMRQCRGTTLFLIEYDVAIVDSVKHATGPLLIEIEKSPGSTIGISLTQKWIRNNRPIIVIDNVKPASIADRCGALHCGDQINAIDQKSFDGISLFDANTILRSCTGDFCRIEVTPANIILEQSNEIRIQPSTNRTLLNETNRQTFYRAPSNNPISINNTNWTVRNSYQNISKKPINKTRHNSISSLNSCYQTIMGNQMCHTETMECVLQIDSSSSSSSSSNGTITDGGDTTSNFGFTLQGASFASDILMQPPIIGYLEPGGVAERSGVLQPGDRILSINGQQLEGMTLEDARSIIKDSNNRIHLEIEFDVADSVMLSSGTCQVKILRKNLDLGLSVTYSRSARADEVPIINDVKRGSIAYRCGMIQSGDRLLSIDSHSLRGKNLNEIVTLLKNCDDIVRLKIKKDDIYAEDNLSENVVVYKVQLLRQGGPLGLTISGSEDIFEPIVVSDLCEGGLADKTNAIHIGDRILAINDVSLRGKGLNEAIKLLQASNDEITLKISRTINPQQKLARPFHHHHHHQEEYTPSVDSAMESWDSSNTEHRFSDNCEIAKEILVNDHQQHSNYQDTPTPHLSRSEFVIKPHQTHSIPITIHSNRSMIIATSSSGYRTPPTNGRPLETIHHSDVGDNINGNEHKFSSILNEKPLKNNSNLYDTKYDNCTTSTNRPRYDTVTLILKRDKRILDFGFSISDRLYGTGVYVNKIRPNGPAELEGTLMPCMRIYKVNNTDVTRMECNQVVPLLSSSPDELTLVVGRRPAPMFDETDELFDIDEDEHQSPIVNDGSMWNSSINTTINENNNTNNDNTTSSTMTTNNTFSLLSQSKTSTV